MQPANPSTTPGVPCPDCNFRIPVTIPMLLMNDAIFCNSCGLKLSIDREQSEEGLKLLQNLNEAVEKVNRVKSNPMEQHQVF